MDTTPPQAPPALVSLARQEAVDARARLAATAAWLDSQQAVLPTLADAPRPEEAGAWLERLDAAWAQPTEDAPGSTPVPRIAVLANRLAAVMRDDALVRADDGTLDPRATAIATGFARATAGSLPPGVTALALTVGLVDYAGAAIVVDRNDPSLVLLFMPDVGWTAFASMDGLLRETEARLRRRLGGGYRLQGVTRDDIERVVADERFVGTRPLGNDPLRRLAERTVALQRERAADAWASLAAGTVAPAVFVDDMAAAMDLHGSVDVTALRVAHDEQRIRIANAARLAGVPAEVADAWRGARDGYALAVLEAAADARRPGNEPLLPLAAFSHRELKAALLRRGFDMDPDDLQVDVTGAPGVDAAVLSVIGPAPATARMTLTAFALHNTGWLDARTFNLVDGRSAGTRGPSIHDLLALVRELDLAPRYARYLEGALDDRRGSGFRVSAMRLHEAAMRLSAADARVATWARDEPDVFMRDRDERGFHFVDAVLDSPAAASRRTVGGHAVSASELVYEGTVVTDILVIGAKDPRSVPRVVLYTPGAPDGLAFREFSDRATAAREFLLAPRYQSYLLEHLPAEYSEPVPNGHGQRRFRVPPDTRRAHWVFGGPGHAAHTITAGPFDERPIHGNVFNALFHAEVVRQSRDVAWAGRSQAQADWDGIMGLLGLASRAYDPGRALDDAMGAVAQSLRATWRFYDNAKAGDGAQAFVDFTEAYNGFLAVAGPGLGVQRAARGAWAWRAAGAHATTGRVATMSRQAWLEPRLATTHVNVSDAAPDALGMHRLGHRRFIRQQGLVFEVRREPGQGTWRVVRPNALDAAFPGPAVERVAGGWRVRTDIGLRGGRTDEGRFPQPLSRVVDGGDLHGLTEFQRWTFQQQLVRNLRHAGEAHRIHWQATYPQPHGVPATLRQQTAWRDAVRTARLAPAETLPLDATPGPGARWRVLAPAEWPESVWHPQTRVGLPMRADGSTALPLEAQPGSGLSGVRAAAYVPPDVAPIAIGPGMPTPEWLQLHLHRYRTQMMAGTRPALRVVEVEREPVPTYVIQPEPGAMSAAIALRPGDYTPARAPSPPLTPSPPPSP